MNIKFKSISIKNFLSFGASTIVFDLNKTPFTLIVGENGSGKSAIIVDALHFALFGKIIRKGIKLSQVVNNINKKSCEVSISLYINDILYRIDRGLSPDYLSLFKEGIQLDERASKVILQKQIEDLLQFDQTTFKNISVLSLNNNKSFMDLTPEETRNVVENLLGIQIYSQMLEKAKIILKDNKDKIKIFEKDITIYDRLVIENREKVESIKKLKENFEGEKLDKLDYLVKEYKKLKKQLVIDEEKQKQKDEFLENLIILGHKITTSIININGFKDKIKELENKKEFFNNTKICPICEKELDDIHKEKELKKIDDDIITCLKYLEASKIIYEENCKESEFLNKKIKEINVNVDKLKSEVNSIGENILRVKNDSIDKHIDSIIDMKVIEEYEQKLKSIVEEKDKTNNEIVYYEFIKELLSDGGIKAQVIKNDLPFLNKTINNYLRDFERTYTAQFDDEFNLTLGGYSKRGLSYYNLSEGEKKRIDIAILLAFVRLSRQKNSISCNILVFDELLETSLDEDGKRVLIDNLLNNMIKSNIIDNIFVISHNKNLVLPDAEIVTIYKDGEFSKLKLDKNQI